MVVVEAFAPTRKQLRKYPRLRTQWLVPCKQCGRIHLHGVGEGPRTAHCSQYGIEDRGYALVFAGEASDELVKALMKKGRKVPEWYWQSAA